jgi:hypothetical protein
MICTNSAKTIEILLNSIPLLRDRWIHNPKAIFEKPHDLLRNNYLKRSTHDIGFKDTGFSFDKKINILFAHFPLTKYELESIEMPMYAAKIFPNANIDVIYYDSRGRITSTKTHYLTRVVDENTLRPLGKTEYLEYYDLMITRSNTIARMKKETPDLLNRCKYKINMQTNNHAPNLGIGEDYRFCYTQYYAPAGRVFTDRAQNLMANPQFQKLKIIIMTGTVVWWKGQAEWIENIDPELIKDYHVLVFGNISNMSYFNKLVTLAEKKKINLLYSQYVNPDFLCDILTFSSIKIMNHYADPGDGQPAIGPARTFGEALAANNLCVHGQTENPNNKEGLGKDVFIPKEWGKYTIEYDQKSVEDFNNAIIKAKNTKISDIDFSQLLIMEEKCDEVFRKCIEVSGIT